MLKIKNGWEHLLSSIIFLSYQNLLLPRRRLEPEYRKFVIEKLLLRELLNNIFSGAADALRRVLRLPKACILGPEDIFVLGPALAIERPISIPLALFPIDRKIAVVLI